MNVHSVFYGGQAKLVGRSVTHSAFHAAARHPSREAVVIVIAALLAFRCWSSTKLASPNHQCFIEEPALFQVLDQRRDPLIAGNRQFAMPINDIAMPVKS